MEQIRIETRGSTKAGFFGAREAAQLPVHAPASSGSPDTPVRSRRSWLGTAARIVRDAVIALALMASIPIGIVAVRGDRVWRPAGLNANTRARVAQVEIARSLALPRDPSVTPMQAGLALNALQPAVEKNGFPMIEPATRPDVPWEHAIITPDMFSTARSTMFHGPSSQKILEAVAKGFTPKEMAYLRMLATAPIWKNFDVVARAPAMDQIGGWLKVPFSPEVKAYDLPIFRYKGARELAYAATSRAAYHMSLGQRDSAEMVLRSVVSFGFTVMDNGTSLIDELIGSVIVGIGRDGLQRFYVITKDPRAGSPAVMPPPRMDQSSRVAISARDIPSGDTRRRLIALTQDPKALPGERYEALHILSASACSNVRELLLGRSSEVTDAVRTASAHLARYPSERALVELISREPELPNRGMGYETGLAASAATVVGTVLHNPRLAACTRILGAYPPQ